MSTAPRNGWFVVLAWSLVLAGAVGACGRTDFDTGASAAASGSGGTAGTSGFALPATPGLVICGDGLCNTATQHCCFDLATSGGVTAACRPLATTCTGVSVQCDEAADCPGTGNVCCAGLGGLTSAAALLSSLGTRCEPAVACSGTGQLVVCSKDSDCLGAGVCCATSGVPTCLSVCPKI